MENKLSNGVVDLRQFIVSNNIVGTSAGVCIALAAKDGIQSLVEDIIIPTIVMILHALRIEFLTKYLPVNGKVQLNITDFVKQLVTFILTIVISFIFVKVAFGYLLGVSYTKSSPSEPATEAGLDAALDAKTVGAVVGSSSSSGKEKFGNIYGNSILGFNI
jgi:large-conductance mechanosensitive channel